MSESSIKAFTIPHEAWHKDIIKEEQYITIGLYHELGGTEGEFKIAWKDLGTHFLAFDDPWEVLGKMLELIELLAGISKKTLINYSNTQARAKEDNKYKKYFLLEHLITMVDGKMFN